MFPDDDDLRATPGAGSRPNIAADAGTGEVRAATTSTSTASTGTASTGTASSGSDRVSRIRSGFHRRRGGGDSGAGGVHLARTLLGVTFDACHVLESMLLAPASFLVRRIAEGRVAQTLLARGGREGSVQGLG